MDTAFFMSAQDDAPLSKRRCFVPSSDLFLRPCGENEMLGDQTFDGPLLQQLCGRTPTPYEIEAELLQVGMRIRKPTTAFTPRPFFNMRRLSPETQAALCSGTVNKQPITTATFCGINLAALAHIKSTPVEEQKMWSYSTSHKRGYEGESDSDDQEFMPQTPKLGSDEEHMAIPADYFNIDLDGMDQVSPTTQPTNPMVSHMMGRRLAKPRSKKRQSAVLKEPSTHNPFTQLHLPQQTNGTQWMGHRRMASCGIEAVRALNGFGEATFLPRREDVDMDCS